MNTEESLYVKILIWAYDRQESGFKWKDLEGAFSLNQEQMRWVQKIFRSNMPAGENLIDHIYNSHTEEHLYFITAKGTSAAVDYLNLKEAKKNSKRAERIALAAIFIGVVVGTAQILVQLDGACEYVGQFF